VIVLLLLYLLLCSAAGFALTFLSRMDWTLEGRLAMGVSLGFCASAMLTWLVAIPFGMGGFPVALGALALAGVVGACARWTNWRQPLEDEVASAGARWRTWEPLPVWLLLGGAAFFFIPFYSHALEMLPSGMYAGHGNIYGDWSNHMPIVGYLSHAQQLLPPNNPHFNGINLNYSFLPDFFSGQLLHLGLDIQTSMPLVSAILSLSLVVLLYATFLRFTGSRWGSFFGVLLLLLGGGIGFLLLGQDIQPTGDGPLGWLGGLVNAVASPARDYTWMTDQGYWWRNPTVAYLIPQRTVVFGWPLGLLALSLLWYGWRKNSRREFLLAGLVVGLMPMFHANSYVDLCIFAGGISLLTYRRWRDWVWFFVPAVVLGAPVFFLMLLPPVDLRHPFLAWQIGWLAVTPGRNDNWIWWWWANTGLLIPLAVISFVAGWGKPGLRRFLLPAWSLFIVSNLFKLQVWDWDNTKWLNWWLIPASMMAGLAIVKIASKGRALAAAAGVIVLLQVTAGALDLNLAWQQRLNNPNLQMLDADEVAVGYWARDQTNPNAVFLTGWQDLHPIRTLGERAEVFGGRIILWTTDIDYTARQNDVVTMYEGAPGADTLLIQYGVDYAVIGPQELRDAHANLPYFQKNFPVVYRSPTGEYQVFKIST
jgi:hypothetical protein